MGQRIAGLGLRASATAQDVAEALALIGGADAVATAWDRADHPALITLTVIAVDAAMLRAQATPTQSPRALERYGCGSLAEAAAMACGRLTSTRLIAAQGRVTVALAESGWGASPPSPDGDSPRDIFPQKKT